MITLLLEECAEAFKNNYICTLYERRKNQENR